MAISVTICQCFLSGRPVRQKWRFLHIEEEAVQHEKRLLLQEDLKKVKLHVWFMRLAYFLTNFLSLHWSDIPCLMYFRWRFHLDMLGCTYKKLYSPLISTQCMDLWQVCFSSLAIWNFLICGSQKLWNFLICGGQKLLWDLLMRLGCCPVGGGRLKCSVTTPMLMKCSP